MKFAVTMNDIRWDAPADAELPTLLTVEVEADTEEEAEQLAMESASDDYGFLIQDFTPTTEAVI